MRFAVSCTSQRPVFLTLYRHRLCSRMCHYTINYYIYASCIDPGAHFFSTSVDGEKGDRCPGSPHERYIVVPGHCPLCLCKISFLKVRGELTLDSVGDPTFQLLNMRCLPRHARDFENAFHVSQQIYRPRICDCLASRWLSCSQCEKNYFGRYCGYETYGNSMPDILAPSLDSARQLSNAFATQQFKVSNAEDCFFALCGSFNIFPGAPLTNANVARMRSFCNCCLCRCSISSC